jgi:hypothetical protein
MEDLLSRSIVTFKFLRANIHYRVKKAVELSTGLEVAIKLMKFTDEDFATRKEMLQSFY